MTRKVQDGMGGSGKGGKGPVVVEAICCVMPIRPPSSTTMMHQIVSGHEKGVSEGQGGWGLWLPPKGTPWGVLSCHLLS